MTKHLTDFQREEAFKYLDGLRDSGTVQMDTGYTPTYLCDVFGHDYGTSWDLLQEWLGHVKPAPVRVQEHNVDGDTYTTISLTFAGPIQMLMALLQGMAIAEQEEP
jgi:hypothetical protein